MIPSLRRWEISQSVELLLEEVTVGPDCPVIGSTIGDLDIRSRFGVIVVAVKRAGGEMIFNPGVDVKIEQEDVLVALGGTDNLRSYAEHLVGSGESQEPAASGG